MAAAGVSVGSDYVIDGKDMMPVLKGSTTTQHDVVLQYCGFKIVAARVAGIFKVFRILDHDYLGHCCCRRRRRRHYRRHLPRFKKDARRCRVPRRLRSSSSTLYCCCHRFSG